MLVHLHGVVHVQQVAFQHAQRAQLLSRGKAEAQVGPGAARDLVVRAAEQHHGDLQRPAHVLQCLQQRAPKALVPAASPRVSSCRPGRAACAASLTVAGMAGPWLGSRTKQRSQRICQWAATMQVRHLMTKGSVWLGALAHLCVS